MVPDHLKSLCILLDSKFKINVFDAGCSGGINAYFNDEIFNVIGVDRSRTEISNLNSSHDSHHYVCANLIGKNYEKSHSTLSNYLLKNTQSYFYTFIKKKFSTNLNLKSDLLKHNLMRKIERSHKIFDANFSNLSEKEKRQDPFYSFHQKRMKVFDFNNLDDTPKLSIDDICRREKFEIDFLKIDIDGDEFYVLQGIDNLQNIKMISIECQFQGIISSSSSIFSNIYNFLSKKGFVLLQMDVQKYEFVADYFNFIYDFPAQNRTGMPMWADCIFVNQKFLEFHLTIDEIYKYLILFHFANLKGAGFHTLILNYPKLKDKEFQKLKEIFKLKTD